MHENKYEKYKLTALGFIWHDLCKKKKKSSYNQKVKKINKNKNKKLYEDRRR
jgi:hypothetical protein